MQTASALQVEEVSERQTQPRCNSMKENPIFQEDLRTKTMVLLSIPLTERSNSF